MDREKRRKLKIAQIVLITLPFSFMGCKNQSSETYGAEIVAEAGESKIDYRSTEGILLPPQTTIAFVSASSQGDYWRAVKAGAQTAVEDLNDELGYEKDDKIKIVFQSPLEGEEVDEQINLVDGILSENPEILCVAALDMNSFQAQFEAAKEDRIPVIAVDSGVRNDLADVTCATDNEAAGREAAIQVSQELNGKGAVAILSHSKDMQSAISRIEGFQKEMQEHHPEIKIVNISYDDRKGDLKKRVEEVMEEYPELDGYVGTNEDTTLTLLSCMREKKNEEIAIFGFDSGEKIKKAIEQGWQVGTVSQNPYGMGYASVVAGSRAFLHMENDTFVNTGFIWVTEDNIEEEEVQKYLYP